MKIPTIKGIIDRRILINYQIDEDVLNNYLPEPFRAKLVNGKGIAGICLIRLKLAVEWEENGEIKEGVFIPRRDTSSRLNSLAGGTIFPGIHHFAKFTVNEFEGNYEVSFLSKDETFLSIKAKETDKWNNESIFEDLTCVSKFFENGSIGYSPDNNDFEGLELKTYNWAVSLLEIESVKSSFFEDEKIFPKGSVKFDNALLMKNIEHEWIGLKKLRTSK